MIAVRAYRLAYYGTYDYCFYETSLVKQVPEYDVMVLRCYVIHAVVLFSIQSFNVNWSSVGIAIPKGNPKTFMVKDSYLRDTSAVYYAHMHQVTNRLSNCQRNNPEFTLTGRSNRVWNEDF